MSDGRAEAFTAITLMAELMIELEARFGAGLADAIIERARLRIDDALAEDDSDDGDAMQLVRGLSEFESMIRPSSLGQSSAD